MSLRKSVKNLSHTSELSSNHVNVKNPHLTTHLQFVFLSWSIVEYDSVEFLSGSIIVVLSALIQKILKSPVIVSG